MPAALLVNNTPRTAQLQPHDVKLIHAFRAWHDAEHGSPMSAGIPEEVEALLDAYGISMDAFLNIPAVADELGSDSEEFMAAVQQWAEAVEEVAYRMSALRREIRHDERGREAAIGANDGFPGSRGIVGEVPAAMVPVTTPAVPGAPGVPGVVVPPPVAPGTAPPVMVMQQPVAPPAQRIVVIPAGQPQAQQLLLRRRKKPKPVRRRGRLVLAQGF